LTVIAGERYDEADRHSNDDQSDDVNLFHGICRNDKFTTPEGE
jgi:hypothetical protein